MFITISMWAFLLKVEGEVSRLEQLKSSKMKELVLKRRFELEEICKNMHMITEVLGDCSIKAIESGNNC